MNNITVRELFKEVEKEMVNINDVESNYKSYILRDVRNLLKGIVEPKLNDVYRVYHDYNISDACSNHVITVEFNAGYVLRIPIIIKTKVIKKSEGYGWRNTSQKYGLKSCTINWEFLSNDFLDKKINDVIESYINSCNARNNRIIVNFEKEMEEFPRFLEMVIQDMRAGKDISANRYRMEHFTRDYEEYKKIKFEK